MITLILAFCLISVVSAVPVSANVLPPLISHGEALQTQRIQMVEPPYQNPEAQTPAPLSPNLVSPQPGVPQQLTPQFLPPLQQYPWSPLGGSPLGIPLQPNVYGSHPVNQPPLPLQPLIFPPFGYFPILSSPYTNQLFSTYRFPVIPEAPLPQTPSNQPSNVLPETETSPGVIPSGNAAQPQQQKPQIVYMLQQPMSSPLGALSSEELEIAAKMGQLGVYLPTVLANQPAGAVQPVSQAAGLANPEKPDALPTVASSPAGVQQMQGHNGSGSMPCANNLPAGLERPAQEATTVQTPAPPKLQPTQGNLL